MLFKAARERMNLTLKQASERAGYSIPTINALELEGRGSDRLKFKLAQVYGIVPKDAVVIDARQPMTLQDAEAIKAVEEKEIEIWKRRAKTAEQELHELKSKLRELLK